MQSTRKRPAQASSKQHAQENKRQPLRKKPVRAGAPAMHAWVRTARLLSKHRTCHTDRSYTKTVCWCLHGEVCRAAQCRGPQVQTFLGIAFGGAGRHNRNLAATTGPSRKQSLDESVEVIRAEWRGPWPLPHAPRVARYPHARLDPRKCQKWPRLDHILP